MSYKESESGALYALRRQARLNSDLFVVVAYAAVMDAALIDGGLAGPFRALFGLPLLFFVPGYGLLAVLFPRAYTAGSEASFLSEAGRGAVTAFERAVLSFGLSLALLPPLALALELTAAGFGPTTIVGAVSAFLFVTVVLAVVRRLRVPDPDQFSGSVLDWGTRLASRVSFDSRLDAALTALVLVAALVATSAVGVGLVAPADGEQFTSVALLSEDAGGNLTTAAPESNLTRGEPRSFTVAVENHEERATEYTLVGEIQRVQRADGVVDVEQEREFVRRSNTVAANTSWVANTSVTPRTVGTDLRVTYLLYRGTVPDNPNQSNAYRSVHVWVDVSNPPT